MTYRITKEAWHTLEKLRSKFDYLKEKASALIDLFFMFYLTNCIRI
jgi:hypothetical protein